MWDAYEEHRLVAYARREKDGSWFVRIKTLNPTPDTDPLYINVEGSPADFVNTLIEMHKKELP
jgi:hypothetical protein